MGSNSPAVFPGPARTKDGKRENLTGQKPRGLQKAKAEPPVAGSFGQGTRLVEIRKGGGDWANTNTRSRNDFARRETLGPSRKKRDFEHAWGELRLSSHMSMVRFVRKPREVAQEGWGPK